MRSRLWAAGLGLIAATLGGCAVATWGGPYYVLNATPDQIVVEYDRMLWNPAKVTPVITEHCAKMGKQPYVEEISRGSGLGMITASCG